MIRSTICYLENNGSWLMLYRDKKPGDMNEGKWISVGGKVEAGETPDECVVREVLEETGLRLLSAHFCGIIKFRADMYEDEDMYLYYSDDFEPYDPELLEKFRETGICLLPECDEGELAWIPAEEMTGLPMWEGDKVFLGQLLEGRRNISMTLQYTGESCKVLDQNKNIT